MDTINSLQDAFFRSMPEYVTHYDFSLEKEIRKYLESKGIASVWHFTDRDNLTSIKKHGLLPLKDIQNIDIDPKYTGADAFSHTLDRIKGLDKYVHLSFIDDHPLFHVAQRDERIMDPIWIEIDISVLFNPRTLFCNRVANAKSARLFKIDKLKQNIDFDTIMSIAHNDEEFYKCKEARKAEILVHGRISPDKIIGVHNGK